MQHSDNYRATNLNTREPQTVASQNTTRTALTGREVLLATNDADRYQQHIQAFADELKPAGQRETILTQSLADLAWRIERVAGFEMAIYAKGRAFFAGCYQDEPASIRPQLIELDIFQTHERELRNLHLQESRLRRHRDRDAAELRFLQAERKSLLQEQQELAAHAFRKARDEQKPFDPAALGFVFSIAQIEAFIARRKAERAVSISSGEPVRPARNRSKAC